MMLIYTNLQEILHLIKIILSHNLMDSGLGSYATMQIMLGHSGAMVPWNSFATIGQAMIGAGFSLRAVRIYIVAKNSDNPSGVLQALLNLGYAIVIVVIISSIDWTKLLN